MLTYVINTSENKTFDSDKLFDLAGYNKIRWMNCALNEVKVCAAEIYEKQNVLGADRFRIAVLVDFYTFDKIRVPYGRSGFHDETGVDISLYMPYIEAYLTDNLIGYLEKKDLYSADFEIYYVQNDKHEPYEFLDNAIDQVRSVLAGSEEHAVLVEDLSEVQDVDLAAQISVPRDDNKALRAQKQALIRMEAEKFMTEEERKAQEELKRQAEEEKYAYSVFNLYCTPTLSLGIRLADYTYGAEAMTFTQFFNAFRQRATAKSLIRRHYYITACGGGPARAAFDTLSLSLYLIRMYEREEHIAGEGELELIHLDAGVLKDVLVTAWSKVNLARTVAKGNDSQYYSLRQNQTELIEDLKPVELTEEQAIAKERYALPKNLTEKKRAEDMYRSIVHFSDRDTEEFDEEARREFDEIMLNYLRKRDETRENNVEAEFEDLKTAGALKMTDQCPSKEEYNYLVQEKQKEISVLFEHVLKAERIEVDFSTERARADKAYEKYNRAKACMQRSTVTDIIFIVLIMLSVLVPYFVFQLSDANWVGAMVFGIEMAGITLAFIVLAFFLQAIKYKILMNRAKEEIRQNYLECCAKQSYSLSAIRRRYEQDLIRIEEARYGVRQLKQLYEANVAKDKNVSRHREMLAAVEDRLSSMLNNLDVEPVVNPEESVVGEFDITKSIRSKENKVYQIFSIETIEKMFPRKGSDKR